MSGLRITCSQHGPVDVPAAGIVMTWTAAGDPSGQWVARMDCLGHRVGVSGLSSDIVRALQADGARYTQGVTPFGPLTFRRVPLQHRSVQPPPAGPAVAPDDIDAQVRLFRAAIEAYDSPLLTDDLRRYGRRPGGLGTVPADVRRRPGGVA